MSKKQFEVCYGYRWQVEVEIKVLKAHGLEGYMVRKLRAIRLWIMAVWHVVLLKLRSKLEGIDFRLYMLSFVFPPVMLELIELLGSVQYIVRLMFEVFSFS